MLDTIEQAVKPHDRYQVEVKLDYELMGDRKTRYEISTYIFIPNTLGINPFTYSKTNFYRNIQNYIRLKTPELILREFSEHSESPLVRIEETLTAEDWYSDPQKLKALLNSLKLLASMLKSSIREHIMHIYRRIDEAESGGKIQHLINNLIQEFITETRLITERYRSLFPVFNLPNVDKKVFAAYQFTDEAISLLIEENAVELYEIVSAHLKKSDREAFQEALAELVEDEIRHQKAHGHTVTLQTDGKNDNEVYTSRASALKKYASSVLFLVTHRRTEGRGLQQLFFAIAAGLSMLFATMLAFYFQKRLGNFTFPLLIALVVGYMFKDRIKEVARSLFANYLQANLYDHRIVIRAPDSNVKLGILKEKMIFVSEAEVPKGVSKRRTLDPLAEFSGEGQREYIILHAKEIILYKNAFRNVFTGIPEITGLNDITRYDIRAFLRKMDSPTQERAYLDEGEVKSVVCHRVYQVDFLSKYKSVEPKKDKLYSRIHLILNRDGIRRIEHRPV